MCGDEESEAQGHVGTLSKQALPHYRNCNLVVITLADIC